MKSEIEFQVNPRRGSCFLCLEETQSYHSLIPALKVEPGSSASPVSVYSIQRLSCYLKMDLMKVFNEEVDGTLPPSLLEHNLKGFKLKVPLCADCASLNEKLSKLFIGLDKIQIEIEANLRTIQHKLTNSKGAREDVNEECEEDEPKKLKLLRKEASEKCALKLKCVTPRIKVQELTEMEANFWRRKSISNLSPKETISQSSQGEFIFQQKGISIKTEHLVGEEFVVDNDADNGSDYEPGCDSDSEAEDFANSDFLPSPDFPPVDSDEEGSELEPDIKKRRIQIIMKSPKVPHPKEIELKAKDCYTRTKSGMYKYSLCPEEFKVGSQFENHFEIYHLSVRCNLCRKVFSNSNRYGYNRHHEKVHAPKTNEEVRASLTCPECLKTFAYKRGVARHRRNGVCK